MPEVEFLGEQFRTGESIGLMPLIHFAHIAKGGADTDDLEGLAAMYGVLKECVAEDEWSRFQKHATDMHADGDMLMKVVAKTMAALSNRPTSRPSVSSGGPPSITPNSTADSSSPAMDLLPGRPDLKMFVRMAEDSRTA